MSAAKTSKVCKSVMQNINSTINALREKNLTRDEKGISQTTATDNITYITYSGKNSSSSIMLDKHISSSHLIDVLLENQQYNVLLYDKSILQAEFTVCRDTIIKERLVFIKKHNKIWTDEEIMQNEALDIDWFSEEDSIPIFIRIDYAPEDHKECQHPAVHCTLSNHEPCRIPIKSIVSFSSFVHFILLHFYDIDLPLSEYKFSQDDTITALEKKMIHFSWDE